MTEDLEPLSGVETRLMRPNTVGELHGHIHCERESCKSNPPCTPLLTLEEFAWRCLWTECGRIAQHIHFSYTLKTVRDLKRRAKRNELWSGPYFEKSEWAGMVRRWYAYYLKTGAL